MVRLKGPLMSMEASGTIGNTLVFAKWKGRDYARRHAIPSNPRSGLQVGIRAVFGFIAQHYASLTTGNETKWADIAADLGLTSLNAYTRDAVRRARRNLGWRADADGDATDAPGAPTGAAATAQPRTLVLEWTNDVAGDEPDYCTAIYRNEGATADTADISILVAVVPISQQTYTDTNLTSGQAYSYSFRHVNKNGGLGTVATLENETPE